MSEEGKSFELKTFHRFSAPDSRGNTHPVDTIDDRICETLMQNYSIFLLNGKLYLYSHGVYHLDTDGTLFKTMISKMIYEEFRTDTRITRIYKLLLSKHSLRIEEDALNNHPRWWVNLHNGMLDLKTMELHPHSPEFRSVNQIPHDYTSIEKETDSVVMDFLSGVIPDTDDLEMFLEYCGYCLTTDISAQKFLIISGDGGLGKSVLLRMMQWVLGKNNYSSMTLQNLNDRFSPAFLLGKLVNIYADLPSTDMKEVCGLKTITGEDTVRGEWKGGAVFFFHPYCKLLFSANQIPKSRDDKTGAYYRRMMVLKITQRGETIPDLEERLKANTDIFLHLLLEAVHRLYTQREGVLLESENSKSEVLELYKSTDSVKSFLVDCNYGKVVGDRKERKALYDEYTKYCDEEEREMGKLSANGFYQNLREKGYPERTVHGTRYFWDIGKIEEPEDFKPAEEDVPF